MWTQEGGSLSERGGSGDRKDCKASVTENNQWAEEECGVGGTITEEQGREARLQAVCRCGSRKEGKMASSGATSFLCEVEDKVICGEGVGSGGWEV